MSGWQFEGLNIFGYDLIMADPAWRMEMYSEAGEAKAPQAHYDCMSLEDIKALRVGDLASDNCLLWLWAIAPMMPQALEVVDEWGFKFITTGTWVKTHESGKLCFGTGYRLRGCAEFFIIATIGNPKTTKAVRNAIVDVRREHSRKPESAYAAAEKLMPNARRADLFTKFTRPGWAPWGNEKDFYNGNETSKLVAKRPVQSKLRTALVSGPQLDL